MRVLQQRQRRREVGRAVRRELGCIGYELRRQQRGNAKKQGCGNVVGQVTHHPQRTAGLLRQRGEIELQRIRLMHLQA